MHSACKSVLTFLSYLLLAVSATVAQAEVVDLKLRNGITAQAEFQPGKAGHPAVVLMHGFLQTHNFPLIAALTDHLSSSGHTVLAPSLSFGINKRNRSLPCEAVHTNTIEDDVAEIAQWVAWLEKKGYKNVVLLGHSIAAIQIAAYLSTPHLPQPKFVLLVSIADTDHPDWAAQRDASLALAQQRLDSKQRMPGTYSLSFCKKYVASPENYISQMRWNRKLVLSTLKASKTPAYAILGSADDRMGRDWPEQLRHHGIQVEVLQGANHFFEGDAEFELADRLDAHLKPLIKVR